MGTEKGKVNCFCEDRPPSTTLERTKALRGLSRIERELGYVDERVADAEIPVPHYEGERYEAEVPDTLDLTDNAGFTWSGSYIKLSGLKEGDEAIVEFPMRQVTVFKEIGDRPYKLLIKGNTVVDISPEGTIYPLYQRDHYMQDKAPVKRVNRFVSREAVLW